MEWNFRDEFNKDIIKESRNWFSFWYYILPLIPLLAGSFGAADIGGDLKIFSLFFLVLTVYLGRTAVSAAALLRQGSGEAVSFCDYVFEAAKFPFSLEVVRSILYITAFLTVVFTLILCLVCGFALLTFALLSLASTVLFYVDYVRHKPGLKVFLACFSQGFILTAAAFYCQSGIFSFQALAVSLPLCFIMGALVLWSDFSWPDGDSDKSLSEALAQKGKERKFFTFIFLAYAFILLNALYGAVSFWCLLTILLILCLKKDAASEGNFVMFYLKFGFLYGFSLLLAFTL